MVKPAPGGGWGAGKLNALLFALLLGGCGSHEASTYTPSPSYAGYFADSHVHVPMSSGFSSGSFGTPASSPSSPSYQAPSFGQGGDGGCGFGGRFDNRSALAYNFDDNRSQIGFNMSVNDHGSGMVNVSRAVVVFRYKFDHVKATPAPSEKCRYSSHWQGLVGSSYNEFVLRDHNTLWGEIKDHGLDFWNK